MREANEAEAGHTEKNDHVSLGHLIGRIANSVSKELSPGDRAELRRTAPGDFGGPAFWKMAASHLRPLGQIADHGELREKQETRWLAILSALAHIAELHDPGKSLGRALAENGYSELRLTRLLRAEGQALLEQVSLTVRFLGSKGANVNLTDLASLILSDDRRDRETKRRSIARDYFASSNNEEN